MNISKALVPPVNGEIKKETISKIKEEVSKKIEKKTEGVVSKIKPANESIKWKRKKWKIKDKMEDCDITNAKLAIVKLIKKVKKLEKELQDIKGNKKPVECSAKPFSVFKKDTSAFKSLGVFEKKIFKKEKEICDLKRQLKIVGEPKGVTFDKVMKGSYKKFRKTKEFKAIKNLYVYEYPFLKASHCSNIKKGERFIGDMYTKVGWVHIKDRGWVRGFGVYPKVKYHKVKESYRWKYKVKVVKDK